MAVSSEQNSRSPVITSLIFSGWSAGAGQSFGQRAELQAEVDAGEFLVSVDLLMDAAHDIDALADDLHPCASGRIVDLHGFKLDQNSILPAGCS